jgi:hypothetical protein
MAKRYQRGNQNPYIEEGQTTQWPKDTKGVIRSCKSKKDIQHKAKKQKDRTSLEQKTLTVRDNWFSFNTFCGKSCCRIICNCK